MDVERVSRLLGEIKESLKIAGNLVSLSLGEFLGDVRNRYTLRLALVEVVEAAATLGLHILREHFNVEKTDGYTQIFERLNEYGVISRSVKEGMVRLARLRNLIVHRYWEIDDARIYREAKGGGLDTVKRFVGEVEKFALGA